MKKNVLILQYSSEIGGAETDLLDFLRHGPHDTVNITVLCPLEGPLVPLLREAGVTVQFLRLWPWRKGKYFFHRLRALAKLAALVKALRIDVIHSNEFWSFPYADAIKNRVPRVLTITHIRDEVAPRKIYNYHLCNADIRIVVSEVIRQSLLSAGADPETTHLHYGYGDYEKELATASETSIPLQKGPIVGRIARLIDTKGIEYFIDAIPEVIAERPDARFLILGSGEPEYEKTLKDRAIRLGINDELTFCGFQKDVFSYIRRIDILVSSSLIEGLGLTMLYAMGAGKPVVATDAGGTKDLVIDGETGYLVPKKNSHLLAERVLCLLNNQELRSQMGNAARRHYEELYLHKDFTSALLNLYSSDNSKSRTLAAPAWEGL
jgi:glycosyltransferase involved in cell wall biosynthesis